MHRVYPAARHHRLRSSQPRTPTARTAAVWREAALEYHEARGNRVSIAPYTPEAIARLCRLMDNSVSLDRAWYELNSVRHRPAASATLVEALMFSLRRGVQELLQPNTRRRLSE